MLVNRFVVFAAAVLLSTYAYARPGDAILDFTKKVAIEHTDRLWEVPYDPLATRLMVGSPELVSANAKAVVVLLAGTGAKSSQYGIGPTMRPVASHLFKVERDIDVIAAENPVYFEQHLGEAHRKTVLDKYATLAGQSRWLTQFLELIAGQIPRDAQGRLTKPIYVVTRSTSTTVLLQLIRDYIAGANGCDVVGDLAAVWRREYSIRPPPASRNGFRWSSRIFATKGTRTSWCSRARKRCSRVARGRRSIR